MNIKNVNFKVSESFHADIKSTAALYGMSMTELLSYSFYLAKNKLQQNARRLK